MRKLTDARSMRWMLVVAAASCIQVACSSPQITASSGAPAREMGEILAGSSARDWQALDPEYTLYMDLPGGRVVILLAPQFAPAHVRNILTLVRQGYFDGLAVLRAQENYVVQWGDPDDARGLGNAVAQLPAEFAMPYTSAFAFARLPDPDTYAPEVGHSLGFPVARDPAAGLIWPVHCYGMIGVGRDVAADSGSGSQLYAVIGHAPRHLDRNITVVGRIVRGMEVLSTLKRGTGALGFYATPEERTPIIKTQVAADVPESQRLRLEALRTDTAVFAEVVQSRRYRTDEWFKYPVERVEVCNVPLPVRQSP